MDHRVTVFAAGSSSTFSLAALGEFLRSVNWGSFLAFAGSVAASGISWYVAARQARRDEDRKDRDERRASEIADMLAELRTRQALAGVDKIDI